MHLPARRRVGSRRLGEESAVTRSWTSRLLDNKLLTGSALLFVSTTVVNLGNYIFNLILGRWLGPAAFADLSLIVTLFLMLTLVTATLQTVVAKFAAVYFVDRNVDEMHGLWQWTSRWSWLIGALIAAGLVIGAPALQRFFHTASFWPFVLLGVGVPIYFAQGVDRGILQGQLRFLGLAGSYQAEMWTRLAVGLLLVLLGFGVNGAVFSLTVSFAASLLTLRLIGLHLSKGGGLGPDSRRAILLFAGPTAAALLGQILINNSDVLLVKRFFVPEVAGQYAALALIGRMVFFATWSVVTVLLPTVAQRHEEGKPHWHLLWLSMGMVLAVSVFIVVGSWFGGELVIQLLFGPAYLGVANLLWLYAIATTLYACANVIVIYRLSTGNGLGSYITVAAGVAQIVALTLFHASLRQVVVVQIVLMSGVLAVLLAWELWTHAREIATLATAEVQTDSPY